MLINSKQKGARGERMWRDVCRSHGFDKVRRTAQYCGNTGDASDCVGLPNIHQEVKFVENLNVRKAYEQAEHDAQKSGDMPIVAWKKSNKPWLVVMSADNFFRIYKESEWSEEHGTNESEIS
jgi:hypothetical protein|nr:MAG TPA: HOLLIDAY JUNCTION RESOLVASE HOMOLOGOUS RECOMBINATION [Caudoviricetes sp.]